MFATISQIGRRFAQRVHARRAYLKLYALDDRMLADIGIHRSHITMVTEGIDRPHRRAS